MKIVHLCLGNVFIDGYSYQENIITKHHALLGYDVTVIAATKTFNEHGEYIYPVDVPVHYENNCKIVRVKYKNFPSRKINIFLIRCKNIYQLLKEENPDIIFSHNVSFWDSKKIVRYLKCHPNVKLYVDSHADYINSAHGFLSKYIKHKLIWGCGAYLLGKYAEKCFGVTPMRCDFLHEIYRLPKEKIEYLPLGIDDSAIPNSNTIKLLKSEICKELAIPEDSFIIATGGKIDRAKNIHHLLSAVRSINNPNIHIIVYGCIMFDMVQVMMQFECMDNIHFVGWCDALQVMKYLSICDLCCFPGTHSTLWEQAVGLGKPCIFKYWGEKMTQMCTDDNCIFVQGDDENELKCVIESLLDTTKYSRLLLNAQKAAPKFYYSNIAKKAIGLI